MQRSAALCNESLGRCSSLKSATCVCAAGAGTHYDKGRRDDISSAFAVSSSKFFPEFPKLQGHTFYMVTPSGDGVNQERGDIAQSAVQSALQSKPNTSRSAFNAAITDLLRCSSWFVAAYAISEDEREAAAEANREPEKHLHYLVALPSSVDAWLERWPTITRNWKKLPCVDCSILDDVCHLVYSRITNVDGLEKYLCGPQNRADFIELLPFSTTPAGRTVWNTSQFNNLETTKKDLSDSLFGDIDNNLSCKSLNLQENQTKPLETVTQSLKTMKGRQSTLTTFHLNNITSMQRSFATRRYASYGSEPISGYI